MKKIRIKKQHKPWLYLLLVIVGVVLIGYLMYTPANIMGIPFFSQAYAVIGPGQTAYAGDTFQHTFTLINRDTQALPKAMYDSDGDGVLDKQIKLYKGYRLVNPNNEVAFGCDIGGRLSDCEYVEEITTLMNPGTTTTTSVKFVVTPSTPSSGCVIGGIPYGDCPYGVSAMLFKVEQSWNRATNTWTETPTIIDSVSQNAELAKKFFVVTQTEPEDPTMETILGWFLGLFLQVWNTIKNLLWPS